MDKLYSVEYQDVEKKDIYEEIIDKVLKQCFNTENLLNSKMYVSIILTTNEHIKEINKKYRKMDKETDVLSFPMFEKEELNKKIENNDFKTIDILGDMIISIKKVEEQAIEYGHSFERELAYMVVHSFYHLIGYDHIKNEEKNIMRLKEEEILKKLNIVRK